MRITRRQIVWLGLAAAAVRARPGRAADDAKALFWQFRAGDSPPSVIFGYERIAASLVPDIVSEGSKRASDAKRVIQDFHAAVALPPIQLDRSRLTPLVGKLDAKTAAALRALMQKSFPQLANTLDQLSGVEATMLLMAEGQTPPNPSVGGTIFSRAQQQGRPTSVLVSDDDLRALFVPPDLPALDRRIGQDTVQYLLELRDKDGPIGAQFEKLYEARESEKIHRLAAELDRRGSFTPSTSLQTDKLKSLLADRTEAALTAKGLASAFVFLPLDTLLGDDGIVAALRQRGSTITAVA
jgi:hypothetical protein